MASPRLVQLKQCSDGKPDCSARTSGTPGTNLEQERVIDLVGSMPVASSTSLHAAASGLAEGTFGGEFMSQPCRAYSSLESHLRRRLQDE
jgi:hypothetical protein